MPGRLAATSSPGPAQTEPRTRPAHPQARTAAARQESNLEWPSTNGSTRARQSADQFVPGTPRSLIASKAATHNDPGHSEMFIASAVVSLLLAAAMAFAAVRKLSHRPEVVETYTRAGVPEERLNLLALILLGGSAGSCRRFGVGLGRHRRRDRGDRLLRARPDRPRPRQRFEEPDQPRGHRAACGIGARPTARDHVTQPHVMQPLGTTPAPLAERATPPRGRGERVSGCGRRHFPSPSPKQAS
jgi:hypothetical protein